MIIKWRYNGKQKLPVLAEGLVDGHTAASRVEGKSGYRILGGVELDDLYAARRQRELEFFAGTVVPFGFRHEKGIKGDALVLRPDGNMLTMMDIEVGNDQKLLFHVAVLPIPRNYGIMAVIHEPHITPIVENFFFAQLIDGPEKLPEISVPTIRFSCPVADEIYFFGLPILHSLDDARSPHAQECRHGVTGDGGADTAVLFGRRAAVVSADGKEETGHLRLMQVFEIPS